MCDFSGGGVGNWAGFKVDLVIDGILRRSFFLFFFFLLDKVTTLAKFN